MDEKATVEWSKIAQELAQAWCRSMQSRSRVRLDEDDIRDFLIDLWLEKEGKGKEFDQANRGQLYNYTLLHLGNSRDAHRSACLLSEMCQGEDEEIDQDRLDFLSYSDDGDFDNFDRQDADDADDLEARLEELAAIRDSGLAGALSEIFGVSDRRGRSFSSEIRSEKVRALLFDAASKRGVGAAEVKKLAAEIVAERRETIARVNSAGGDLSYSDVDAFEEMVGLKPIAPSPTAMPAKNRSLEAKQQRKSAQSMQLELV